MAGTFLKNLLGELSLDRAMIQILDQPYLQDLATRLKQNEAVSEIMNKLDKDEGVYGWMDYDQLMQLREIILPEMLMKHSELESPSSKIGGELGETFDDQFQSIFGKKKLAGGGAFKPKIKASFIRDKIGELINEFSEKFGIEGPVFDENPQAFTRDIANWIRLNVGDEFFFHPKVKDSIKGNLMHLDQVDVGMDAGKHYYPDIMETAMEKYPLYSGLDDDLSKLEIPQEDLRNALGSAYATVHTFKELLNAMEKAKGYQKTFPDDDIPKHARGGITSLNKGGPYGDVLEYINLLDKEGKKFPVPWDKLDEEYQDAWTEAIKKKHREEHYSDTEHGWDVLGFTAQPDYIAQPYKRYWNEEEGFYQKEPYSPEQIEGESWWDKQRRISGRLEPYGFDMGEWAKLTGKDELAWAKGLLQSATPGTGGIPGFWGALANPVGDYIENWEDYASQTGDYPKFHEQLGSSLGVGLPLWWGIGKLGNKLPPGMQSILKELFPLTFDKTFGKGAGKNWYKSMIRNPLNVLRTHVDPWFNKRMIQQGITKLAPRLAAKGPLGAAGPLGWAAALGLGAYDVYSVYKWLQDNSAEEMEELIPENE